jgi:hypothetical protein
MIDVSVSSTVDGGFIEANLAYQKRWGAMVNSRPLPTSGSLLISDGSSPVANFRPEEAFSALVALANTPGTLKLITDVGCGGTYHSYGGQWGLQPKGNQFWRDFYEKTGLMDRVSCEFAPISEGVNEAIRQRKAAILEMWALIGPYLGTGSLAKAQRFFVNIYEEEFGSESIAALGRHLPEGAVIMTFPCCVCSHQTQTTVLHAIRKKGKGIDVTRNDRSPAHSGCKGGFAWLHCWNELTIWEATYYLGGRLSGKAIYELSSQSPNKPGILVRDYSDPRGTLEATIAKWTHNIWISPRVYLNNSEGTIKDFQRSLSQNPQEWARVIEAFPMFGNGRRFDIKY